VKREAFQIARDAAEDAQRIPVTVTVPYELRQELADWIIAEVKKLELGALAIPKVRPAAGHRARRDHLNARADLWRALHDQVLP
jgi:hypothetical protein